MTQKIKTSGFSIIELLVIISIIGLLASIILLATNSVRAKTRDSQRISNIHQLKTALDLYYNDRNAYPVGKFYSAWDTGVNYSSNDGGCWCQSTGSGGKILENSLVTNGYLAKLPEDPLVQEGTGNYLADGQGRGYVYISDGQSYVLGTYLETSASSSPASDTESSCKAAGNFQSSEGDLDISSCPTLPYTLGYSPPPLGTPTPGPTDLGATPTDTPPGGGPCGSGYLHCRTIAFDRNKYGNQDSSNFVALIKGDSTLIAGSKIRNVTTQTNSNELAISVPADLIFTSDAACSNKLKWEFESYTPGTGAANIWVNIGTLGHNSNTVIYACYDNPAATGWQGNDNGNVWDNNYLAVWHFADGTTLNLNDSAAGHTLINHISWGAASGLIGGGTAKSNGTSQYFSNASIASPDSITVSYWQKMLSGDQYTGASIQFGNSGSASNRLLSHSPYVDDNVYWDYGDATNGSGRISAGYGSYYNAWTYVTLVYNNNNGLHAIYLNGQQAASNTSLIANPALTGITINTYVDSSFDKRQLDEYRISNVARSADQILAEYNNQSDPTNFYTVGTEQ